MTNDRAAKRRAMALLLLIFAFAAMSVLAVGIARMLVLHRRVQIDQEKHLQAVLLADAGVERAAARLQDDPQYPGETWTVSPEQLGLRETASVQISVVTDDGAPDIRIVKTIATLADTAADSGEFFIRHIREARFTVATP